MTGISEDDLERIARFNRRPRYRRDPTLLCPDQDVQEDEFDE